MNAAAHPETNGVNPWLVAFVVSIATFMEVLDTTITNVSLSHIAGELGASPEESTWVLTSYLVSNGIVLPLSGWLSNVFGRKRYFMMCIVAFSAASFACGAATSLGMLIVFRLIQGLAGGGLQPTQQAIILDAFPPEKRAVVFSITGITMIVAPIIGPTLGGFITDNFSWRWVFFINVPVGIIAFLLVGRLVHDPKHAVARGFGSIDYIGLGLIALGLGLLQIMLDKGTQEDWFGSDFILTVFVLSMVSLISAILWLLRQKEPIVDLRLLTSPSFGIGCVLVFTTGFVLYSTSALLPLMVQAEYGYNATLAGLVLSPGGMAVVVLMPLVGKLTGKVPLKYLIVIGFTLTSIGTWMMAHITPQVDYRTFVFMRIVQVAGLPFLFIPISTLAYSGISKEKNNKASALYALFRNLGGSIGIALAAAYYTHHHQIRHFQLAENMDPASPVYQTHIGQLERQFLSLGSSALDAAQQAVGHIYSELLHQSAILAYQDTFRIMAMVTGIFAVVLLLSPLKKPSAPTAAVAAH